MFNYIGFCRVLLGICSIAGFPGLMAQCTQQVTHTSGTQVINCTNVTVTPFGGADVLPGYCPSVTTPYLIGYSFANGNQNGGYTFTFSPPVSGVTLNFSGVSNTFPSAEEVMLLVNGSHYAIPAPGANNACDAMAVLTPGGNVGGCANCSVSGWSGTTILNTISTLTVFDTIVSGAPNGALFSLYICTNGGSGGAINLGNDTTLCPGNTLVLDATVAGATYLWQDNSTNPTFTVNGPGTYFVQVTTGCGVSHDTLVVSNAIPPTVSLGNDTSICNGSQVVLDATMAGATYVWQDNSTNPTFTVTTSGTYFVTVTTNCGTAHDTVVVTLNPSPVVNLGSDSSLCPGDSLVLDVTTPGATYLWNNNTTLASQVVTNSGTYWVQVNLNGCTDRDTITVTYQNSISVDLGNDTNLCSPNALLLNATTPASTYLWQDNSTNPTLNATSTGTYWVQVTNGCMTVRDTIDLIFSPTPSVSLGSDSTLCPGAILSLDVTAAGASYQWQNNSTQPVFTVVSAGTYWVHLTIAGCTGADTVTIQYYNPAVGDLGPDTLLCDGETLVLNATSTGATYLWQDHSTQATYTVSAEGKYGVTMFTPCGNYTDSIYVKYQNCDCHLYIPNTFTPNQDELNTYFYPVTECVFKSYRFMVFDRWGREIFVTEDPLAKWSGTDGGMNYPVGVYAYRVEFEYEVPHALPEIRIGHINLLR